MAHFTKEMKQRLKDQGWEFSHGYYDYVMGKKTIYSNKSFPGVYVMETGTRNFAIYSDVIYKIEEEKIQEAYKKRYNKAKIEFTPNPLEVKEKICDTYVNGYYRGYNYGYKIAKMKYSFNFFSKTRKKIRQFLQNIGKQK